MTATTGASTTTSAIPDDNVSAWNYVPRPSFADGLDPWQRSNGTPPTTGGTTAKGDPFPGDAIRMQSGMTAHDGLVMLDVHGEPADVVTVHADRAGIGGTGQIRATLRDGAPDGPAVGTGDYPSTSTRGTEALALDVAPHDGPLWLHLETVSASIPSVVYAVRAHYGDPDGLGIFSGDDLPPATEDTEGYRWTGEPWASASYLGTIPADPEPDPDPEPGPGPVPRAALIARVLTLTEQDPDDEDVHALAAEAVDLATALVYGYTRGRGFTVPAGDLALDGDEPLPHGRDLAAVIVTAGARIMANPEQVDYFIGSVGARNGFTGWTLAERAALHNYRRTWA